MSVEMSLALRFCFKRDHIARILLWETVPTHLSKVLSLENAKPFIDNVRQANGSHENASKSRASLHAQTFGGEREAAVDSSSGPGAPSHTARSVYDIHAFISPNQFVSVARNVRLRKNSRWM